MEIILLNKNDNSSTSLDNDLRRIFLSVESHHKHFTKHPSKESYPKQYIFILQLSLYMLMLKILYLFKF